MLAGLLKPSYGTVRVFGQQPFDVRHRIGYMSHAPMVYDDYSAAENLAYYAALYAGADCLTPGQALALVGLDAELTRPLRQYSQGMRQRVSLARVLLPRPQLLLLDEPFSNMDRASALQMLALLAHLRNEGRTIVLTTHQRELAEPVADRLLTLEAGRLSQFAANPLNPRLDPMLEPGEPQGEPPGGTQLGTLDESQDELRVNRQAEDARQGPAL
jgi:ABC-type multidrug transport system ATPase subunit